MNKLRLLFKRGYDPELVFVEAEDETGKSIRVGKWVKENNHFVLELTKQDFGEGGE